MVQTASPQCSLALKSANLKSPQTLLKKGGSPETAWGERKEGGKLDEKVREGKKLAGKRETRNTLWRRQYLWGRGRDAKGEGWGGIRVSARSRALWRLGSGRTQRPHPTLTMKGDSMKTSGVKLARKELSQPAPRLAEPEPGSLKQARALRRAPWGGGQQELFLPGWRETARRLLAAGTAWKTPRRGRFSHPSGATALGRACRGPGRAISVGARPRPLRRAGGGLPGGGRAAEGSSAQAERRRPRGRLPELPVVRLFGPQPLSVRFLWVGGGGLGWVGLLFFSSRREGCARGLFFPLTGRWLPLVYPPVSQNPGEKC